MEWRIAGMLFLRLGPRRFGFARRVDWWFVGRYDELPLDEFLAALCGGLGEDFLVGGLPDVFHGWVARSEGECHHGCHDVADLLGDGSGRQLGDESGDFPLDRGIE